MNDALGTGVEPVPYGVARRYHRMQVDDILAVNVLFSILSPERANSPDDQNAKTNREKVPENPPKLFNSLNPYKVTTESQQDF